MVGILGRPDALPLPTASIPRPQRVKRLELPSRAALNEQLAALQMDIDDLQGRIYEIKAIVDNKTHNRHMASPEFLEARSRLMELNAAFKEAVEAKRAHREELDLVDKMRDRIRSDARSLREKLPYVKVEQIDGEIVKLEYRLNHSSLALQEEKRMISQIESLRKSRDCVKEYDKRMDQLTQDESSRAKLVDEIKKDDRELNDLKMQQEEQRKILADIRNKEASQALDIPALLQEKDEAFEKIKAFRGKMKELKEDFAAKEDMYWKREREWRTQQALDRRLKAERIQAERRERDEIRKQRALENFVEPYTNEIILCDQLISYTQKYAPCADELQIVSSQKAEVLVAPKGFGDVIVSKKNRGDEDLEGWFGGFGGGKAKGKKPKAAAPAKSKEREKMSLSLDALTSFQKVQVSPPSTLGDVLKSLDELKERKTFYLDMQKKARETPEEEENGDDSLASMVVSDGVVTLEGEGESGETIDSSQPVLAIDSADYPVLEASIDSAEPVLEASTDSVEPVLEASTDSAQPVLEASEETEPLEAAPEFEEDSPADCGPYVSGSEEEVSATPVVVDNGPDVSGSKEEVSATPVVVDSGPEMTAPEAQNGADVSGVEEEVSATPIVDNGPELTGPEAHSGPDVSGVEEEVSATPVVDNGPELTGPEGDDSDQIVDSGPELTVLEGDDSDQIVDSTSALEGCETEGTSIELDVPTIEN